jgi:hypothetical protein
MQKKIALMMLGFALASTAAAKPAHHRFRCDLARADSTENISERVRVSFSADAEESCTQGEQTGLKICFGPAIGTFSLLSSLDAEFWDSTSSNIAFGSAAKIPREFQLNLLFKDRERDTIALAHCRRD